MAGILAATLLVSLFIYRADIISGIKSFPGFGSNLASVSTAIFGGSENLMPGDACLEYAKQAQGAGVDGSVGLRLTPDAWHTPVLKIYCGGRSRADLGAYAGMTFMIRSEAENPDPAYVSFYTFAGPNGYDVSQKISVNQYIESGSVSTSWRKVNVPMSSFKTGSWNLSKVDAMTFSVSQSNTVYNVDDIVFHPAADLPTPPAPPAPPVDVPTVPVTPTVPVPEVPSTPTVPAATSTPTAPPTVPPTVPAAPTTPIVPIIPAANLDLTKQFKIWSGETSAEQNAAVEYGALVSGLGSKGSFAYHAKPDQWHKSSMNLGSLSSVYRQSLSKHDYVQMNVKVVPQPGKALPAQPKAVFQIYAWPNTSAPIQLERYAGAALSSEFKTIRIPTSALRVAGGFDLSSLEHLYFSIPEGTAPTYSIVIDDIYAVKSSSNDVVSVKPVSNTTLKLVLKSRYDMKSVIDPNLYMLRRASDARGTGKSPAKVGRQMNVVGFEGSAGGSYGLSNAPIVEPVIYLTFAAPLADAADYVLTVKNIPDTLGNNFAQPKEVAFKYVDKSVTGSVQANQVGFQPVSPKFAYIGNYLGDAGALQGVPASCEIINASTGAKAGTFPVTHRGNEPKLSGNNVYSCNFSSLTQSGTYHVYVPGFGKSYDFKIAQDVYADVFKKLSNFYYNQRADIAIVNGQWSRAAGTLSSDKAAKIHPTNFKKTQFNPLAQESDQANATFEMLGGWYDAGDYGKYILPASAPINELLFAYELYPQKFKDGQAGLPAGENGDGIPDILNEVKYEMDWFQKMQVTSGIQAGGVYDRLTAQDWEVNPYDIKTRYLAPVSTHATAVYVAAMAQAARVFKSNAAFEAKYPGYADSLLAKAKVSWKFLNAHPKPEPANGTDVRALGIGGGDYQDTSNTNCRDSNATPGTAACPYSDVDNRAWAAAELYKTTGEAAYHDAFKKAWAQTGAFEGLYNNFIYHNVKASFAYVTMKKYPTDPVIVEKIKTAYRLIADEEVGYTNNNNYRVGYRLDVPSFIGWGAFAQSAAKSFDLIKSHVILGDAKYLEAAKINLDVELGANPQSISYITGVGSAYPKSPLHLTSIWLRQNSGATAALPGIPVFGPHYRASEGNPFNSAVQSDANTYPSFQSEAYPLLRRYFDVSAVVEQSEFGINTTASILAAFAYFAN